MEPAASYAISNGRGAAGFPSALARVSIHLTDIWQSDILSCMKKRTTIYLDEADRTAIVLIKQAYGVTSDSDAIRLALRLLAEKAQERTREC